MINFYEQIVKNRNLLNFTDTVFLSFPSKTYKWNNKYFKIFNSINNSYNDKVVKDVISTASDGLKQTIYLRNNIKIYRKINKYVYNLSLDNKHQGFISLYTKKELTKSILSVKFTPQRYLKLNKIKTKQRHFFFKRYLAILFKNTSQHNKYNCSYRLLKSNKKLSVFLGHTYTFVKKKRRSFFFVSGNGFLLSYRKKWINKKTYPGIFFLLDIATKIHFRTLCVLLHSLLSFFGKIFTRPISSDLKLYSTMFIYSRFYKFLATEIIFLIKQKKIKFRRKKNKIMNRYTKFFNRIFNKTVNFFTELYKKKFLSLAIYKDQTLWVNWLLYATGFNKILIFTDDIDDNKKILRFIKQYPIENKIILFKQLIYLLQLHIINKMDILKLYLEEEYYQIKSYIFNNFLKIILKKNLFILKISCLNFFSSDVYLLATFKYYQVENIFNIFHSKIIKNVFRYKINEFSNANNFCWKILPSKMTRLPGLNIMKQLYYRKRRVYKKRFYKKYWFIQY